MKRYDGKYTEKEILAAAERVLQGDKNAFLVIYEAYYPMAVSILRRVLRTPEIEGLANEAFMTVYKSLKNFKGQAKLSTYVYRIMLNFAFAQAKKQNKRRSTIRPFPSGASIEDVAARYNVEQSLVEKYFIEQAMATLSRDLIEALDLFYFQDYSVREISGLCGISEGAVKSRLFQAREKIRAFMPQGGLYAG